MVFSKEFVFVLSKGSIEQFIGLKDCPIKKEFLKSKMNIEYSQKSKTSLSF